MTGGCKSSEARSYAGPVRDLTPQRLSIQQRLYPQMTCFGCGPANPQGLQLNSFEAQDAVVSTFQPWPQHGNGFGYLNGGITSTLLDCHSAAAMALHATEHGWITDPDQPMAYVTAGLNVRFLRPSPLVEPAHLVAHVTAGSAEQIEVVAELHWEGKVRARAESTWKRWRDRTPTTHRPH